MYVRPEGLLYDGERDLLATAESFWLRGGLVERRSLTGKLFLPALYLQLTGDHLSG